MAKIQIKSDKITSFGGVFSIMEQFDRLLSSTVDRTLGMILAMFPHNHMRVIEAVGPVL